MRVLRSPDLGQHGPAGSGAVGSGYPDPPASGDTVAVHDPFEGTEFIVLEFDPRTAGVSVLTTPRNGLPVTSYSDINRDDAIQDASAAANGGHHLRGMTEDECDLPPVIMLRTHAR
jgi:hypothetical protein